MLVLLPFATQSLVVPWLTIGLPPDDGEAVANAASGRTLVICHAGDDICLHGDLVLLPHLTYALSAEQAADFAASNLGY
jgi:cutinase